jgi:ubiquitin carboxyl-terminal hydrolase 10
MQLPWFSPDASPSAFPRRSKARGKRQNLNKTNDAVALPHLSNASNEVQQSESSPQQDTSAKAEEPTSETSTVAATSARETPATSQAPSEADFTQVSTPTTPAQAAAPSSKTSTPAQQHARKDTRTAVAVPNIGSLQKKSTPTSVEPPTQQASPTSAEATPAQADATTAVEAVAEVPSAETPKSPPKPSAPKSWADLVRTKEAKNASTAQTNGTVAPPAVQSLPASASLAEALRQHAVVNSNLSFLEPRGLVNPGNMCYMNSVSLLDRRIYSMSNKLTNQSRFSKSLCSAARSTTSSTRFANALFTL